MHNLKPRGSALNTRPTRTRLLAVLLVLLLASGSVFLISTANAGSQSSTIEKVRSAATAPEVTAEKALSTGKPTILYFYTQDICRIRYCRQPQNVAFQLQELYGDSVNFVRIIVRSNEASSTASVVQSEHSDLFSTTLLEGWLDLELDDMSMFQSSWLMIIDDSSRVILTTSEFFTWDEINPVLREALTSGQ